MCNIANGPLVCFSWGLFLGLSDMYECLVGLQMAVVWLDNHPPGCKSRHDWTESLAIKLAIICDI